MKKYAGLLALLGLMNLTHVLDFVIMMPLGPRLQTELGLTAAQFAALVSAYTFAAGITGFLGAFYIDRFDRKTALLFLYGGFTLATAWCGVAHGFQGLLIARVLAGMFGGITGALVQAVVGDVVPVQDRGKAMGFIGAVFPIASVLGVPLALWLAGWQGWQAPFLGLGALSLLIWTLVLLTAPRLRAHLAGQTHTAQPAEIIRLTFRNRGQLLGLGVMACQVLGHFTLVPLLSTYLVRNVGFLESQLGYVYLVGGLLQVPFNPFAGWLTDRYGRVRTYLVFCCTAMLPLLTLSHLGLVPLWQALTVTGLYFILSGTRFIPASALLNDQVDSAHRGSYMGFVSCVQQVTSGAAAYLAGWLVVDQGPGLPLLGYPLLGWFCAGFTVLAGVFAYQMRERVKGSPLTAA